MTRTLLLILALSAGLVVACGRAPEAPLTVAADDPHARLQAEMERGGMDFSNVIVIRLQSEGKRVEVTSVLPATIAEAKVSGHEARTIFRINPAGDGMVLFSRDILKGSSSRVDLPLAQLESRKGLSFPVVQPDGSLKEQSFALERILRPDLTPAKP
jgi:hypothetical protein